jgi:hypothetical protein
VMTRHRPCPAAPGPLEEYAARFDDLFSRLAQRRGFREYLAGLLAPPSYDGSSPGVARGYTDADRADRESTEELMFCRPIS